jgi:glycosyltransferase involved in cell wall biosynthesis
MASAPTVTIGVPVYNGERYLEGALDSILAQSFRDFEVIISDNASSDRTEAIGRAYAARDPRVVYRRNPQNIGLSGNFNLLVHLARGRMFKWAGADDILRPAYLERCVAALDADPEVVLAYPRTDFVDDDGMPLSFEDPGWHLVSDDISERLLFAIQADQWMNAVLGLIRTDALRRTRLMPRYAGPDCRLLAELSVIGKFYEVPEALFVRRVHTGSYAGNVRNAAWLRRYMSGSRRGLRLPSWRLRKDYAGIVLGAPIPVTRKVVLLVHILREMRYRWRRLLGELVE